MHHYYDIKHWEEECVYTHIWVAHLRFQNIELQVRHQVAQVALCAAVALFLVLVHTVLCGCRVAADSLLYHLGKDSRCQFDCHELFLGILLSQIAQFCALKSISKTILCSGGMAPSEWMLCVRAIRDTPVGEYSAPGINTMLCIAYRPVITVSPLLLLLSVFYFKRSLWQCG